MRYLLIVMFALSGAWSLGCAGGDDPGDGDEFVPVRDRPSGVPDDDTSTDPADDTDPADPTEDPDADPDPVDDPTDPDQPEDPVEDPTTDPEPDPQDEEGWARTFGGSGVDWPHAVASTEDGMVVVAGSFATAFDIDGTTVSPQHGGTDGFVVTFDDEGNLLWHLVYGSAGDDEPRDLAVDADGGIYVVGDHDGESALHLSSFTVPGRGSRDAHVFKLDSQGNEEWVHALGDERDDTAYAVDVSSAGQLTVAGRYVHKFRAGLEAVESPSPGYGNDIFVTALDANTGDVAWLRALFGLGSDIATSVSIDANGRIVAGVSLQYDLEIDETTTLRKTGGDFAVALVSLNPSGDTLWGKVLGGTTDVALADLVVDPEGRIFATGSFKNTASFGPVNFTADGLFDAWAAAFDHNGGFLWAEQMTGASIDQALGLTLNGDKVYVTGRFTDDLAVQTKSLQSNGEYDIFVVSLDVSDGTVGGMTGFGGTDDEQPGGIANAGEGGFFVAGYTRGTFLIDNQSFPAPGSGLDAFVVKGAH